MQPTAITLRVPATSANLGPGFDTLTKVCKLLLIARPGNAQRFANLIDDTATSPRPALEYG